MPNVETETYDRGLKEYIRKGSFLGWFVGSSCRYKRFCPALAALLSPVQIFFPHHHAVFHFIGPSSSKLGRQSCCITCLLICVSVLNVCNVTNGHPAEAFVYTD
jgi:hypothetical protein